MEPELIEPSCARAFQFISSNLKKRVIHRYNTDLGPKLLETYLRMKERGLL